MKARNRRFYRATLALHQRFSGFARDCPSHPKAKLHGDAAEEMRLWAIHIDNDVRPLPPTPAMDSLTQDLDFEAETAHQEFMEAARQFDPAPQEQT